MRRFILGLTFALSAAGAALGATTALERAGWTLVTASDDTHVYMRAATPQGGLRRVWTAYDAAKVLQRDGFSFRSVKSLSEFDCKQNRTRVVEETYHAAPALSGRSWRAPNFSPTSWATPEPSSVGAIRMAFACRALSDA